VRTRSLGRAVGVVLLALVVAGSVWGGPTPQPGGLAVGVLGLRGRSLSAPRRITSRLDQFARERLERWWRTLPPAWLDPIPLGNLVLIDDWGYGLTPAHLVEASGGLEVRNPDGVVVAVKVVAVDRRSDVAVVRVQDQDKGSAGKLHADPYLLFAPALTEPTLGAEVTVVGRSLGGEPQVLFRRVSETDGVLISDRRVLAAGLLVLDGPVPAGWDGSAVVGAEGTLVGLALGWSGEGRVSGYTLSAQVVERGAVRGLERVREGGWLGVEVRSAAVEGEAVVSIESVTPGSPAQQAGLEVGDIVRRWEDRRVPSALAFRLAALESRPGDRVSLGVLRGGKAIRVSVVPGAPPRPDAEQLARDRLGVTVQELTPELALALGVAGVRGLAVVEVEPGGPADRVGLRPGDVIVALGELPTPTLKALGRALETLSDAEGTVVRIRRGPAEALGELRLRPGP